MKKKKKSDKYTYITLKRVEETKQIKKKMSNNNTNDKDKESVPLLSSNGYKYRNRSKNSTKQFQPSKRVSSFNIPNNDADNNNILVSDFDHVDSWGMLHESDTDYGYNYDLERGDRLMDSNLLNKDRTPGNPDHVNAFIDHTQHFLKDGPPHVPNHLVSLKHNSNGKLLKKNKTKRRKNKKREDVHDINNSRRSEGDVVIDVDALLKHVQQNTVSGNNNNKNRNNFEYSNGIHHSASLTAEDDEYDSTSSLSSHTLSISSSEEDEYNSRPTSRGSSSVTSSLDDVCLVLEDENTNDNQKVWPDVSVLEEFSKEETERLRRQALEDAEKFHFQYDETEEETDDNGVLNRNGPLYTSNNNQNNTGIFFSHPIVTNIDVPELGNKKVNEAEQLSNNGRLRPKRVAPWHLMQRSSNSKTKLLNGQLSHSPFRNGTLPGTPLNLSKIKDSNFDSTMRDNFLVGRNIQYPHHIISNNPEHFRFAYFRMDLDATVHSPTISGLLQPGQKFEDLFVSSIYMNSDSLNQDSISNKAMSPSSPKNNNLMLNSRHSSNVNMTNTNFNLTVPSQQQQQQPAHSVLNKAAANVINSTSAANLTTYNSGTGSGIKGKTPSVALEDVHPFWLDVINPTEEEMKVLSKAFGIHPLTTEDIFLGEVREKVESFKDYYLICFRSFDIVAEKHTRRKKIKSETCDSSDDSSNKSVRTGSKRNNNTFSWLHSLFKRNRRRSSVYSSKSDYGSISHQSITRKRRKSILKKREEREKFKRKSGDRHKPRAGELEPLNVYIIVFRTGVLTFHFAPTPHPINVRRRARLLKDYLNVTSDWIAYALIDDITDAFGPMIELIEDEVYDIEDAILKMNHSGDASSSSETEESEDSDESITYLDDENNDSSDASNTSHHIFNRGSSSNRGRRRKSIFSRHTTGTQSSTTSISTKNSSFKSNSTRSTRSSSSISTFNANLIGWKKKGDMLRRIGDCRKRVMSILRLLGAKADVIKGFAKRYNGQWDLVPQTEIGMYLDDIQDHIITMVSSLNHYEKLLSRSHSNYLAQINIDMTKVNNDMNDVLGKITILGTIVLPMNVITGLWGMNVIVPGQFNESLTWFFSILLCMIILAYGAFMYTKRRFGF